MSFMVSLTECLLHPQIHVGALMPNVAIFRDGAFEEVIKELS